MYMTYTFENPLKNEYNMCHLLIFVKSSKVKITIFLKIFYILFELFINPPLHPDHSNQRFYLFQLTSLQGGEESQPQQFLVRATFSSFSGLSHLEILVLRIFFILSVQFFKRKHFLRIGSH